MLNINFKNCCTICSDRKTYIEETPIRFGRGTIVDLNTEIGCEHQKVCKKYIECWNGDKTDEKV